MNLAALLTALAVLLLVGLILAQPFLAGRPALHREISTLYPVQAEFDRAVEALHDLDFDHELGKIPAREYPAERQRLMAAGVELLRRLDVAREAGRAAAEEDALEAEIAARRRRPSAPAGVRKPGDCPQCAKPVQVGDRFCPHCGAALRNERAL
jgi:hypothetical protein